MITYRCLLANELLLTSEPTFEKRLTTFSEILKHKYGVYSITTDIHSEIPKEVVNRLQYLREKLKETKESPGVYLHKDGKNRILYVGKAKNLRARLRSYFYALEQQSLKTRALVEKIFDFDVIQVETEAESLILENNLIKHHKPPYNILLRDDKTYPYIKVTLSEEWPRVLTTRQKKNDGARYFGPYTQSNVMYALLSIVNRFYPIVKCKPHIFQTVSRPCNYFHIKKCLAPCHLMVPKAEYNKYVQNIIKLLEGQSQQIIKTLKQEMRLAAENLEFEQAALLRNQITALNESLVEQHITLEHPWNADVIAVSRGQDFTVYHVMTVRQGKVIGGNNHILKHGIILRDEEDDLTYQQIIDKSFLIQYYQIHEIPGNIYAPKLDLNSKILMDFNSIFKDRMVSKNLFLKDGKKELFGILSLCVKNAETRLQDELNLNEQSQQQLQEAKTVLNLPEVPLHIECFDISTFQGTYTVASQVVFRNGISHKSEYRHYIIKTVEQQNDFASLQEVIRRRFKKRDDLPNLLLIDGGEPQVREVSKILWNLGLRELMCVGIAKSRTQRKFESTQISSTEERMVVPTQIKQAEGYRLTFTTIPLKVGSPSFRLFTQIRDEAHRFAIQFHRKRRDSSSQKSVLKSIPGLGTARQKILLTSFDSLDSLKNFSIEEIFEKTKIPRKVIESLLALLNSQKPD